MAFTYDPSRYRANQLLSSLIACMGVQFFSLAASLWWLSIIAGALMIVGYRQPELRGRKGLKGAIIFAQLSAIAGGLLFLYFADYRPLITLMVLTITSIYPIRVILKLNREINAERKRGWPRME